MTATPAPKNLSAEFTKTVRLHNQLESATTEADLQMQAAIDVIRWYRGTKKDIHSSNELDYGLVAELLVELELLVHEWD